MMWRRQTVSEPHVLLHGAAALMEMLDIIGTEGKSDKDVAKILCDNEIALAELARFVTKTVGDDYRMRDLE